MNVSVRSAAFLASFLAAACGLFDFGNERRADDGGVSKAAKDGDVSRQRNPEAYGDGQLRCGARAAKQSGKIFGKRIFRSGHARPGDEIEKSAGGFGNFGQAVVGGSRRAQKN